ncbi:DUF4386 domain-containing protein [Knoellia sp. S7-12]|uniref:DUF4386 domain-containing protein n=1 Tax=Knoellia sp. S7-12 TaxID=3126698 RepID=UPI0033697638
MSSQTLAGMPAAHARASTAAGAGSPAAREPRSGSRMLVSRLIGALFLLGFLSYGTGALLVASVIGDDGFLATLPAHQTALVLGAVLMLVNTAVDIGKAVLIFPVIDRWGRRTALTYLATMIFEVALMAVGALALLMLLPLARQAASGQLDTGVAQSLGSLAVDANELAYQIGQMSLGFGAMFLAYLLVRSGLIPRPLAILGLVGYATHMLGALLELFGIHLSMVLLIPGGIFEVSIAVWLLVKGFRPEAYSRQP